VYTGAFEKYGIYAIADPRLRERPDIMRSILLGYSRLPKDSDHLHYVMVFCIEEPLVWEGEIVNLDMTYFDLDMKPGRMRLICEGGAQELKKARNEISAITGGGDTFDVAVDRKSHLTKVDHELSRVRKLFFRLSLSVISSTQQFRNKCKPYGCQETVHNMFVFSREFGQRGISVMDAGRRGSVAIKLINLCIDWVSFVCDDCVPTDHRTFRWTVVALEFAMVMTRGVNIVAISNEQFAKLRLKVADCMTLLISHFDIIGARSKAAQRSNEVMRRNKYSNIAVKDDDELMAMVREETNKKIDKLEELRQGMHQVGKVLDDSNADTEFLTYLASSFSNVSIRWQQGRFIGGGAFGSVYAAVNLDTGAVMAVKEIRLQDTQSIRHVLKSIKDEMTVLEILSHPNIVHYYGVEVHRDRVFIFMEYCQGGSLAGLLEYGRIEDEQVIQVYTLQMLEGLAYLHQSGIVHRDIKPENILLDHMGVVKFVDFGAAKMIAKTGKTRQGSIVPIGAKTKLNSMTGTPMYMSPEVITGADSGRHGSIDIWSTGCCVLEMATGRRPWANLDNEWAIMYHIAAGHLPQLPSKDQLSPEGKSFLMKCLERDPTKRPSAVDLLNDPWIVNIRNIVLGYNATDESVVSSPSDS
jgi:mitogen-activated protein kinase kinase kinase